MGPTEWLRLRPVVRLRQKLGWRRRDFMAMAMHTLGKLELTKPEVASLLSALRGVPQKPPAAAYEGLVDDGDVGIGELTWVANPPREAEVTGFDVAGDHLRLRLATPQDTLTWALCLFESNPRLGWAGLLRLWRQRTRLSGYEPLEGFPAYPLTPGATKALARARRRDAEIRMPLPDSGDLNKRYWGLEVGDVLPHADGDHGLEVTAVRVNLGSFPSVSLRRVSLAEPLAPTQAA